jgi:uncharacterized protein (TIGR02996 family)
VNDGARMLAGIIDDPDDDLRRLVFADWLEEEGHPERAEFIRLCLEYDRMDRKPCGCPDDGNPIMCPHCRELWRLRREQERFLDPSKPERDRVFRFADDPHRVMGLDGYRGPRVEWDWARGFVQEVRCPLAVWRGHGPTLARLHPILVVRLTDREPLELGGGPAPPDWMWRLSGSQPDQSYHLPPAVFERLTGREGADVPGGPRCAYYDSEAEALADVSSACLSLARSLPPSSASSPPHASPQSQASRG